LPTVVVKTGPEAGRRVELDLEVAIGRQDGDLVVEDPEVSRRHAVLRRSGGSVVVEDLDSTNGTFVNGERIRSPITVGPGDQVRVGGTTLEIEPDLRADDTIVSTPPRPDQIGSAEAVPSGGGLSQAHEDATQPLPSRRLESTSRPPRSNRKWLGLGAAALVVLLGVTAYVTLVDRPAEDDFAARANEACAAVQRPEGGVDLSRTPTRVPDRNRATLLRNHDCEPGQPTRSAMTVPRNTKALLPSCTPAATHTGRKALSRRWPPQSRRAARTPTTDDRHRGVANIPAELVGSNRFPG